MPTAEVWRPCPDFEHWYEVSSFGRVRSRARGPVRILAQGTDKDGYPTVAMNKDGKRTPKTVHRLVCRAFHGEPFAPCREAAHLDGNRTNPRADNLAWVGKIQNQFHKRAHGTHSSGSRNGYAKLNEHDVRAIRALKGAVAAANVAAAWGISRHTVPGIWQGRRWGHLLPEQPLTPCNPPPHHPEMEKER